MTTVVKTVKSAEVWYEPQTCPRCRSPHAYLLDYDGLEGRWMLKCIMCAYSQAAVGKIDLKIIAVVRQLPGNAIELRVIPLGACDKPGAVVVQFVGEQPPGMAL